MSAMTILLGFCAWACAGVSAGLIHHGKWPFALIPAILFWIVIRAITSY